MVVLSFTTCKKPEPMPDVHTKKVSYDIDGNYGEFAIVNLFINGHPEKSERQETDANGRIRFRDLFHTSSSNSSTDHKRCLFSQQPFKAAPSF